MKTLAIAFGVLPIVASAACSKQLPPPGELVVAVSTDVSIPKDIDTIRMQVLSNGAPLYDQSFAVFPGEDGVKIPATLGIVAGSDPTATVVVRVIAIGHHKALILREATSQVPTDRTALLQLPLQWLSEGSAADPNPLDPTALDAELDVIVEAKCKANETNVAGRCESDSILEHKLPTYDPALVYGGGDADGGGKCFDTLGCFPSAAAASVDMTDCTVPIPEKANTSKINVALMPANGAGICGANGAKPCFVPLDEDSSDGWITKATRIQLPPGFCDLVRNGLQATVTVSTDCASKTPALPTCGPWSADGDGRDAGTMGDATVRDSGADRTEPVEGEAPDGGEPEDSSTTEDGGSSEEGGTVEPPSCVPGGQGISTCGFEGFDSCCSSLGVEAGTYDRTYTNAGDGGTARADLAAVSAFRLDKYLVTVGRFRKFVNAVLPPDGGTGWTPPDGSGKHAHLNAGNGLVNVGGDTGVVYEPGWSAKDDVNIAPTDSNLISCTNPQYATWTVKAGDNETLPVNCENWYEAYAFCIWDGGFLPSESEWEYVAAGGSDQREYAWGVADPGTANLYAIYADPNGECYYPTHEACVGTENIAPVGIATMGAGRWGQLDMAGELAQWTLDDEAPYVDPCTDCANFSATATTAPVDRVTRGGLFSYPGPTFLLPPLRAGAVASVRGNTIGFRCARAPAGPQ